MGDFKKSKNIKQKVILKNKNIVQDEDPEKYYSQNPAWTFANVDQEMWAFSEEHIGKLIWSEIIPRLKAFETQTWNEILVYSKKTKSFIRY